MEFTEVVTTRRPIYEYTGKLLDDETLQTALGNIVQAPSSYNLQPWEFIVLREDETQQLFHETAYDQDHVTGVAAPVIVLGNRDPEVHTETVTDDMLERGYLPSKEVRGGILDNTTGMVDLPEQERYAQTVRPTSLVVMSSAYAAWDEGVAPCLVDGFDVDAVLDMFDIDGGRYESMMFPTVGYSVGDADEP